MGWFSRKSEPQPKEVGEEVSPVQESLDRLNTYSRESFRHLRASGGRPSDSSVILDWKATEEQRKLLHEYGVIPAIEDKTGKWVLFGQERRGRR